MAISFPFIFICRANAYSVSVVRYNKTVCSYPVTGFFRAVIQYIKLHKKYKDYNIVFTHHRYITK